MQLQQAVHGLGVDGRGDALVSPGVLQHGGARADDVAPGVQRGVRTVAKVVIRVNLQGAVSQCTPRIL